MKLLADLKRFLKSRYIARRGWKLEAPGVWKLTDYYGYMLMNLENAYQYEVTKQKV